MALLCAAYGWTPQQLADFTPAQVHYFVENLPEVLLRSCYPIAALESTIRNMMGGKRRRDDGGSGEPPLEEHELFTPVELLPWYARPAWVDDFTVNISVTAARDFLAHREHLPGWVLQLAPIDEIRRAAQ